MDIKHKPLTVQQPVLNVSSQALFDGVISLSSSQNDLSEVLFADGYASLAGVETLENRIILDGVIHYSIIYRDVDGEIDCQKSMSSFRHSMDAVGVTTKTSVNINVSLTETENHVKNERSISVSGVVDIDALCFTEQTIDMVEQTPNIQVKQSTVTINRVTSIERHHITITEEKRLAQTLPPIKKVAFANGFPSLTSIKTEDDRTIVEGEINVNVLYLTQEEEAPLSLTAQTLSVGEMLPVSSTQKSSHIFGRMSIDKLDVTVVDEEQDIIRISADLTITLMFVSTVTVPVLTAAYSMQTMLEEDVKTMNACSSINHLAETTLIRDTLSLGNPKAVRIICSSGKAIVSKTVCGNDILHVEGIILYNVCYCTEEGMVSKVIERPFQVEISAPGLTSKHNSLAIAVVKSVQTDGSGRDINVSSLIVIDAYFFLDQSFPVLTGLTDLNQPPMKTSGLIVYFADEGDTLWDVSKRFLIDTNSILSYNPDIAENDTLSSGQKLLLFTKR